MKQGRYDGLAHRAGTLRRKYKLYPMEAACCVLWLAGAAEEDIPALAEQMQQIRKKKGESGPHV